MMGEPVATPSPKIGSIDLNLLVVFDAIMQERSVTRAGDRLGLSQPAMSHALTRLRHMLKDALFVRSPKGMVPTPRAEQLAIPIRSALDGFQHALEPTEFNPSTTTQSFRVAVDNYAAIVLVGPLAAQIVKRAPGAAMDFRPSGTLNLPDLLDRAEIDLAIGPLDESGERFSHRPLLRDDFVALLRRNHPATRTAELSLEQFAALAHLEISSVRHGTEFVDKELVKRKLKRRVALRAPFLSAAQVLMGSDMVSVVPRRIAQELVRHRPLVVRPLGLASPVIDMAMIWPRRLDSQPAHQWLRDNVLKAIDRVGADPSGRFGSK
jgi:DNA-binding transcriptional LysR family regulator